MTELRHTSKDNGLFWIKVKLLIFNALAVVINSKRYKKKSFRIDF